MWEGGRERERKSPLLVLEVGRMDKEWQAKGREASHVVFLRLQRSASCSSSLFLIPSGELQMSCNERPRASAPTLPRSVWLFRRRRRRKRRD